MANLLIDEDESVREHVQSEVGPLQTLARLKSDQNMTINLARNPTVRQPSVYRATLADSRNIKILFVKSSENKHLIRIRDLLPDLEGSGVIPEVILTSANAIISDFVEGDFPDLGSKTFATPYAQICAKLHRTGVVEYARSQIFKEIEVSLETLKSKKKISASTVSQLSEYFDRHLPETIRHSYVYADLTKDNFVLKEDGGITLIDFGSLQKDRLTDMFLFSHGLYDSLSDKGFWKDYQQADGPGEIYAHRNVLRVLSNLHFAAQALESLKAIRFMDWRKRRSRKAKIKALIDHLQFSLR